MKRFSAPKIIFTTLVVLGVGLIMYGAIRRPKQRLPEFITAERRNVVHVVSATGSIVAENSVNLAFERGGRVIEHYGFVGARVQRGDVLAKLDQQIEYQQLKEREAGRLSAIGARKGAEAALEREKTRLAELRRGARKEEIALAEIKLRNAKEALKNAQALLLALKNQRASDEAKALEEERNARANLKEVKQKAKVDIDNLYADTSDIVNNAYTIANDAIRNQIDALFTDDATSEPRLAFAATNVQLKIFVENERVVVETLLDGMEKDRIDQPLSQETSDELIKKTKSNLAVIRDFLHDLYRASDKAADIQETTILSYQTNVNAAATNVNTTIANINNHEQAIALQKAVNAQATAEAENRVNNAVAARKTLAASYDLKIAEAEGESNRAQGAVEVAEEELQLKQAGATREEIQIQQAHLKEQEAAATSGHARVLLEDALVARAEAELQKMTLASPIDGVITADSIKIGEIVAQNTPLVTVIGDNPYRAEAFIPEIDITHLEAGDAAEITVDALGDEIVFNAKIVFIDPAETVLEGVSAYKTTLVFDTADKRVKSGMTVNIEIVTDERKNVVAVPARLVAGEGAKKTGKIVNDGGIITERAIVIGLRGSDGYVEIVNGVNEGEKLVIFD